MYLLRSLYENVADLFRPHPFYGYSRTQKIVLTIIFVLMIVGGAFCRYMFIKATVREAIQEERIQTK